MVTREHHDIDIAVLRADLGRLWRHLDGWTVWINEPGRFLRWGGERLLDGDACFMARPEDGVTLDWATFAEHPQCVELVVEESASDTWIYRRDQRLQDSLRRMGRSGSFLAPEVALLYKAPQADVDRNKADFLSALPYLDDGKRRWLGDALRLAHPGHPWIAALAG